MSFQELIEMANRPIRSAQVISPFGVGAMMDFPGPESLIHAGLDAWSKEVVDDPARRIMNEPHLARSLGVDFFVTPPPSDHNKPGLPWLRFPRWHFCPRCGLMAEANLHDEAPPRCEAHSDRKKPKMLQMRFVAACANGHLRDFPWVEWLAAKERSMGVDQIKARLAGADGGARLRMRNTGEAGGAGVRIELVEMDQSGRWATVLEKRILAGAFGGDPAGMTPDATPLSRIGVQCCSENPATAISPGDDWCTPCDAPLLVVLRGAGNIYFADVASAIHIPERVPGKLPEELLELFEDREFVSELIYEAAISADGKLGSKRAKSVLSRDRKWIDATSHVDAFVDAFNAIEPLRELSRPDLMERLRQLKNSDALNNETLAKVLAMIPYQDEPIGDWATVPDGLLDRIHGVLDNQAPITSDVADPPTLRENEYLVFSQAQEEVQGMPKSILKIRSHPIEEYGDIVKQHFEHVSLLDTLRETRVLKGFSRLYARHQSSAECRKLMWRKAPQAVGTRWLPATMVYGEGIFLRFRAAALAKWEAEYRGIHGERLQAVTREMNALARRRGVEAESSHAPRVMIHTFSHLLINQLIFDSGYGSSSLRERLYFGEPADNDAGMAGVLIYTAAGDSEGSMGGLVRLGEPGKLEGAVRRALEGAMWCSSDPVCIESRGQGPDNCNLAACHSCALLPETSCENQNRLLDRGTVVGTLEQPDIGYFSGVCRSGMSGGGTGGA